MPLVNQDIRGGPSGVNRAVAPHLIQDNQAVELDDFLCDRIGFLRQRGPVKQALNSTPAATVTIADYPPEGIAHCVDPAGNTKVLVATKYSATQFFLYGLNSTYTTATNLGTHYGTKISFAPHLEDGGGVWVGLARSYDDKTSSTQPYLWRGGCLAVVNEPGGETVSTTRGSTTVTGSGTSFTTEAEPGMFLYARTDLYTSYSAYLGVVKSVSTDTSLTLESGALDTATARAYQLRPVRNTQRWASKGRITCTTAASDVTGSFTKFTDQGFNTEWLIFRAKDMAYIGKVSTVIDNDSLTLTANAGYDMSEEPYVAINFYTPFGTIMSTNYHPGWLVSSYIERQIYAGASTYPFNNGHSRIYFSDPGFAESVHWTDKNGDYIVVPNFFAETLTPIIGIKGTFSGILVFKERETALVTGDSIDTFSTRPLYNDGCLDPRTIVAVESGVMWAGRRGINYYDGASVSNITQETLGDWYVRNFQSFDHTAYGAWAFVHRNHYFLHLSETNVVLVVNLQSGAVTEFTNMRFKGATNMPPSSGRQTWYVVENSGDDTVICNAENLFDESGVDNVTCDGESAGPRILLESKKYDMGEPMTRKWWKALGVHYKATGSDVSLSLAAGLDGSYAATLGNPSELSTSSTFVRKRIKFHKFSEFISFKLVGETPGSLTTFWISELTLWLKGQRKDRWH